MAEYTNSRNPLGGARVGSPARFLPDGSVQFYNDLLHDPGITTLVQHASTHNFIRTSGNYSYQDELTELKISAAAKHRGITASFEGGLGVSFGDAQSSDAKQVSIEARALKIFGTQSIRFDDLKVSELLTALQGAPKELLTASLTAFVAMNNSWREAGASSLADALTQSAKYPTVLEHVVAWMRACREFEDAYGEHVVVEVKWGAVGGLRMNLSSKRSNSARKYGGKANFSVSTLQTSAKVDASFKREYANKESQVAGELQRMNWGEALNPFLDKFQEKVSGKLTDAATGVSALASIPAIDNSVTLPKLPDFHKPIPDKEITAALDAVKNAGKLEQFGKARQYLRARKKNPKLTFDEFLAQTDRRADARNSERLQSLIQTEDIQVTAATAPNSTAQSLRSTNLAPSQTTTHEQPAPPPAQDHLSTASADNPVSQVGSEVEYLDDLPEADQRTFVGEPGHDQDEVWEPSCDRADTVPRGDRDRMDTVPPQNRDRAATVPPQNRDRAATVSPRNLDRAATGRPQRLYQSSTPTRGRSRVVSPHRLGDAKPKEKKQPLPPAYGQTVVPLGVKIARWTTVFPWLATGIEQMIGAAEGGVHELWQTIQVQTLLRDLRTLTQLYNFAAAHDFRLSDSDETCEGLASNFRDAFNIVNTGIREGQKPPETIKKALKTLLGAAKTIYHTWDQHPQLRQSALGMGMVQPWYDGKKSRTLLWKDVSYQDGKLNFSVGKNAGFRFSGSRNYNTFAKATKFYPIVDTNGEIAVFFSVENATGNHRAPSHSLLGAFRQNANDPTLDVEMLHPNGRRVPQALRFRSLRMEGIDVLCTNDTALPLVLIPLPMRAATDSSWQGSSFHQGLSASATLEKRLDALHRDLESASSWSFTSEEDLGTTQWDGDSYYVKRRIDDRSTYVGLVPE